LQRARRLLGGLTAARRRDLAQGLQELAEAVSGALELLSEAPSEPGEAGGERAGREDAEVDVELPMDSRA
jgi:hypothetical protein